MQNDENIGVRATLCYSDHVTAFVLRAAATIVPRRGWGGPGILGQHIVTTHSRRIHAAIRRCRPLGWFRHEPGPRAARYGEHETSIASDSTDLNCRIRILEGQLRLRASSRETISFSVAKSGRFQVGRRSAQFLQSKADAIADVGAFRRFLTSNRDRSVMLFVYNIPTDSVRTVLVDVQSKTIEGDEIGAIGKSRQTFGAQQSGPDSLTVSHCGHICYQVLQ